MSCLAQLLWSKDLQIVIRSLVSPGKPSDKIFTELVNIVKNHLNPRPLTTVYYFKFHSCFQKRRRIDPVVCGRMMSVGLEYCDFRDQMEDMIKDRLLCGVNDERTQRQLLHNVA